MLLCFSVSAEWFMRSVGETESLTEISEVEDSDSAVICVLASKSCNKYAINCLV